MDRENNEVSIDINKIGGSPLPSIAAVNTTTVTRPECHTEMYIAARKGDWKAAEDLLRKDPNLARAEITANGDGALHVAAASKNTEFVIELVKLMSPNDLLLQNKQGLTAFCCAAESGIVEIADVMRRKNPSLVTMRGKDDKTPLQIAAFFGKTTMVIYLWYLTREEDLSTEEWFDLLIATIRSSVYDVALAILEMNGSLAKMSNEEGTALHHLVQLVFVYSRKEKLWNVLFPDVALDILNMDGSLATMNNEGTTPHHLVQSVSLYSRKKKLSDVIFPGRIQARTVLLLAEKLWAEVKKLGQEEVIELIEKPFSILHEAAKEGTVELIDMIANSYPHLLLRVDENNHTILHTAVLYRQERVFTFILKIGHLKGMLATSVDKKGNNLLHVTGILAPPSRLKDLSVPAFQMERELLWFAEVKKLVPPSYRKMKNKDGQTPREVFSGEHQHLLKDGEKWIKETSNFWILIATLIATVAFSAAIALPGGNHSDTGMPLLLKSKWFTVFLVSDAVAMLCATRSMLTFLFIITSRYSEGHFIKKLPGSFRLAVVTLEYAVIAMLVAFASAFYLVLHKEKAWIPYCVFAFTCLTLLHISRSTGALFYSRKERM